MAIPSLPIRSCRTTRAYPAMPPWERVRMQGGGDSPPLLFANRQGVYSVR